MNKTVEIYIASMMERPQLLAGKLYYVTTYKRATLEMAEMLLNSMVSFLNYEDEMRLVAYAFFLYKKEHQEIGGEEIRLQDFIVKFRRDVTNRMDYELEHRE